MDRVAIKARVKASTELTSGLGAAGEIRPCFRNDLPRPYQLVNLCRRCDKQIERLTRIDSPHHPNGHIRGDTEPSSVRAQLLHQRC